MQQDNSHAYSNRSYESAQGVLAGGFLPSTKLMEKIEKLIKWRIDPSLIDFPKDASELHGGHATVSRALLRVPSSTSNNIDDFGAQTDAIQQVVAVKKLRITAEKYLERVLGLTLREAGLLIELSHPRVVMLEGFVEKVSEGVIWLVFPWEANGNLRDFIASRDWEIPERICLIFDVATGVEYLHLQNPSICHGDLKSVNILVNSSCRALITDFGSARRLKGLDLDPEKRQAGDQKQPRVRLEATFCALANTITLTGNEYTLRWAAPELLSDEPPTTKIDIWALGWIAYEVMTNAIPFEDVVKDSIVVRRVTQGQLPSITGDSRMSLMLQLCCLMSECWSIDPSQRPTAMASRKSLTWMPMIVPNPNRTNAPMVPEARSPQLLLRLGDMHQHQDDYANASKLYTEALRVFTDAADRTGKAETLVRLDELHLLQGKNEDAVMLFSGALEIFTSIDDKPMKAKALFGLAQAYKRQGKHSEAATFYSDALKINTDINYTYGRASALFGLAEVHRVRREFSQAVPLYTDALRIRTDIGDRHGRASALWGLAQVHLGQSEYDQAITLYSDALQIFTDIGNSRGRAFALVGLADVSSDQGRPKNAIDLYKQASQIYKQMGDAGLAVYTLERAADARRQMELVEETA